MPPNEFCDEVTMPSADLTQPFLRFAAKHRSARLVTAPETVTSTLVMMGISPFFRAFGPQTVLEDVLQDPPEALVGLSEVLRRANRAANFLNNIFLQHKVSAFKWCRHNELLTLLDKREL